MLNNKEEKRRAEGKLLRKTSLSDSVVMMAGSLQLCFFHLVLLCSISSFGAISLDTPVARCSMHVGKCALCDVDVSSSLERLKTKPRHLMGVIDVGSVLATVARRGGVVWTRYEARVVGNRSCLYVSPSNGHLRATSGTVVSHVRVWWACRSVRDAALRLQLTDETTGETSCFLLQGQLRTGKAQEAGGKTLKRVAASERVRTIELPSNWMKESGLRNDGLSSEERRNGEGGEKLDTTFSDSGTPVSKWLWLEREIEMRRYQQNRKVSHTSWDKPLWETKRNRRSGNAHQPQFRKTSFAFSIAENMDPHSLVGVVTATDADVGLAGEVTYSMNPVQDTRSGTMFKINSQTGRIVTAQALDREVLPRHEFTLIARDKGSPVLEDTATLVITVLDENDNSPVFEKLSYQASIFENIRIGKLAKTVYATDDDYQSNGTVTYSLSSAGNYDATFAVHSSSGDITNVKSLDREHRDKYPLTVIASDGGPIPRSAAVAVTITILDVNDSPPKFDKNLFKRNVSEDTAVQTVVLTVTATSDDLGSNSHVSYSIVSGNSDGRLSIDSTSGDIFASKELDYEKKKFYRLVIQAQDSGIPPLTSSTTVDIQLENVNDNSPRFPSETTYVSISENTGKHVYITSVAAVDNDEGSFGKVSYRITSSRVLDTFTIGSTTGKIKTLKELDYESHTSYEIEVLAEDGGSPPQTGKITVVVTLTDVNDEFPQFTKKEYRKSVLESAQIGTTVLDVSATDKDFPPGGHLRYSITAGDAGIPFSIAEFTGRIVVASSIDHELQDVYNFVVMATDGELSNTTAVQVRVTDENDSPPIFKGIPYKTNIAENVDIGTPVFMVVAVDDDQGTNSEITFSLEQKGNMFAIDPSSGKVTTATTVDYESITFMRLIVVAVDGGNPSHTVRTHLDVHVLNENDNSPVFSDEQIHTRGRVKENVDPNTMVLTVSATDEDEKSAQSHLTYSFAENTTAFHISAASGVIRTSKQLDRELIPEYHIRVQAIDSGDPPRTGETTIVIEVLDVSDNPPEFQNLPYSAKIYESASSGSNVIQVMARSRDSSVSDMDIRYSIQAGDELGTFEINPKTGYITLANYVDAEVTREFTLKVQATAGFHFANAIVHVTVLDLNDNPPSIEPLYIHVNILEGTFHDQQVGHVRATDPDSTSILIQGLVEKLPSPFLQFNNRTGGIIVMAGISEGTYVLNTSVSDGVTTVSGVTHVIVRKTSNKTVADTVILRVVETMLEPLVRLQYAQILKAIAKYIQTTEEMVNIYSIQYSTDFENAIDILFAVKTTDFDFLPRSVLISHLDRYMGDIENDAGIKLDDINVDLCLREPCQNFQDCSSDLTIGSSLDTVSATSTIFHSIHHSLSFSCYCPSGYIHTWTPHGCVEQLNDCMSNPCLNSGSCIDLVNGFQCLCMNGTAGDRCQIICPSSSCDLCNSNPCLNGGTCSMKMGITFECLCLPGFDGPNCEQTSAHFQYGSRLAFPSLTSRWHLVMSFEFATVERNGLLLYNGRYGAQYDFIAVEIVNGRLVGRVCFGSNTAVVTVQSQLPLADGEWHTVIVSLQNQELTVAVENCVERATGWYTFCCGYEFYYVT